MSCESTDSGDPGPQPGSTHVIAMHVALRGAESTLATAESLTGGALAALITSVAGASSVYRGGVVAYATSLKVDLLGVSTEVVDRDGVVSAACAEAMAEGVRRLTGATYALSTTGVAGPDRQEGRPAGTVYVGLAGPEAVTSIRLSLSGDRERICVDTCSAAMEFLMGSIHPEQTDPR